MIKGSDGKGLEGALWVQCRTLLGMAFAAPVVPGAVGFGALGSLTGSLTRTLMAAWSDLLHVISLSSP